MMEGCPRPVIIALSAAVIAVLLPLSASADPLPGPYPAEVVSVYDGDTATMHVQVWPGFWTEVSVRFRGIDTPELRGKCRLEKQMAQEAKNVAWALLDEAKVTLHDVDEGKYAGRVVATVKADGQDVGAELVRLGLAREYDGGRREGWCDGQ